MSMNLGDCIESKLDDLVFEIAQRYATKEAHVLLLIHNCSKDWLIARGIIKRDQDSEVSES